MNRFLLRILDTSSFPLQPPVGGIAHVFVTCTHRESIDQLTFVRHGSDVVVDGYIES
jgi:hypothetical protein